MRDDDLQGLEDYRCVRCGRKDFETLSGSLICADCEDTLDEEDKEDYLYG